jgi:hypothetical protein
MYSSKLHGTARGVRNSMVSRMRVETMCTPIQIAAFWSYVNTCKLIYPYQEDSPAVCCLGVPYHSLDCGQALMRVEVPIMMNIVLGCVMLCILVNGYQCLEKHAASIFRLLLWCHIPEDCMLFNLTPKHSLFFLSKGSFDYFPFLSFLFEVIWIIS